MKITTGKENYEILDTGTIITFKDESISFHLATDLKIIMSFKKDDNIKEKKMDFNFISDNELEIILTNFCNSSGIGNIEPMPLATINNRQIYLNFNITAHDDNLNKTVCYTWYSREEATNA